MFDANEAAKVATEKVFTHLRDNCKRGDVVAMGVLAEVAGMDDSRVFRSQIVWKARRLLLNETGIHASGVRDAHSLLLLTVRQQLCEQPVERRTKARRQLRKLINEQEALTADDLAGDVFAQARRDANVQSAKAQIKSLRRDERAITAMSDDNRVVVQPAKPATRSAPPSRVSGAFSAFAAVVRGQS